MSAYKHRDRWRYRVWVQLPSGERARLTGTPQRNSKAAAERAARAHAMRVLRRGKIPPTRRMSAPVQIVGDLAKRVHEHCVAINVDVRTWVTKALEHELKRGGADVREDAARVMDALSRAARAKDEVRRARRRAPRRRKPRRNGLATVIAGLKKAWGMP